MNKLSRLLIRRLERIARREAQRNAHRNGLLTMKVIEINGHLLRRYAPAFDTGRMTGDPDRDLAWLGRNFAGYLLPPPKPSDIVVTEDRPDASSLTVASGKGRRDARDRDASIDHARRAYAVGLVGRAGRAPLVSNIVAALVLARMIENSRVPFAAIMRAAIMPAPVVSLHAPIAGFEQAMRRLIETSGFVPGGGLSGIDGEYVYDDVSFATAETVGRTYIQFLGHSVRRIDAAAPGERVDTGLPSRGDLGKG